MSKKLNAFIPEPHEIIGSHKNLDTLEFAIRDNIPVLLIGETGVGKTSMIRHLAAKHKQGLRRVNLNGQTTVDEFVGKMLLNKDGTYWQDGVLIQAMKEGHWIVLDELNAALPEILFVLHSLLDDDRYVVLAEKDGDVVRPHPDFRVFATMNPSGKYSGTKDLNKALMSRFPIILQIDYPDFDTEVKILTKYAPKIEEPIAMSMVKMAQELRKAYQKDEIEYVCSTRDIINFAILSQTFPVQDAIQMSILARANSDDEKAVNTMVALFFGKKGETPFIDRFVAMEKDIKDRENAIKPLTADAKQAKEGMLAMANRMRAMKEAVKQERVQQSKMTSDSERLDRFQRVLLTFVEMNAEDTFKKVQSQSWSDAKFMKDFDQIVDEERDPAKPLELASAVEGVPF